MLSRRAYDAPIDLGPTPLAHTWMRVDRKCNMQDKLIYSVTEVLELVPLSRTGLYRVIANGELRSVKIGRRRAFSAQDLIDYVSKVTSPAGKGGVR